MLCCHKRLPLQCENTQGFFPFFSFSCHFKRHEKPLVAPSPPCCAVTQHPSCVARHRHSGAARAPWRSRLVLCSSKAGLGGAVLEAWKVCARFVRVVALLGAQRTSRGPAQAALLGPWDGCPGVQPGPRCGPRAARSHGSRRRSRALEGWIFAKPWLGEAVAGAGSGRRWCWCWWRAGSRSEPAGLRWGPGWGALPPGAQSGWEPLRPCSSCPGPSSAGVRAFKCGCAF